MPFRMVRGRAAATDAAAVLGAPAWLLLAVVKGLAAAPPPPFSVSWALPAGDRSDLT